MGAQWKDHSIVLVRSEAGRKALDTALRRGLVELHEVSPDRAVTAQKVDARRIQWGKYSQAWRALGRPVPEFPVGEYPRGSVSKNNPEKTNLERLLVLAMQPTEARAMKFASRWLFRKWSWYLLRKIKAGILRRLTVCVQRSKSAIVCRDSTQCE